MAIKGGQVTPFEKVKAQIADEARKAKAGKAFTDAAEKFNDVVYEQFDSLQPAADTFKLTIQKSDWVSRAGGNINPLFNNEKLLAAAVLGRGPEEQAQYVGHRSRSPIS